MRTLSAFLLLLSLWSCNRYEGGVTTPAWLRIDQVNFTTNSGQGSDHHNINTIWVYHDNQLAGVYEIPAMVPVLANGTSEITIIGGVINNGISSTRTRYPFLEHYVVTKELVAGDTISITPQFQYFASTKFWIEDFEGASISFLEEPTSLASITTTNVPGEVFEGNGSGKVSLDQTNTLWEAISTSGLDLGGSSIFLEMSYKNDNSMLVGTVARNIVNSQVQDEWTDPLLFIQPKAEEGWKKIYIDLQENVNFYPTAEENEIQLSAILDTAQTSGTLLLDNIKIVYY